MKGLLRENFGEAIIGLAVVVIAAAFIVFAWRATGGGAKAGAIKVTALFPNASGVNVGTDVKVAGLKIGNVTGMKLDPQSYQVAVTLALDPSSKLPNDSTAAVSSEGLLGATLISLTPGGSATPFKNGDTITDTQGAMDLMALVGQFINKGGAGGSSTAPAKAAGAGTAP
jgi:phospholipid/cholesterol/gamma-HCH transport system substrate-binding protein